MSCKTGGFHCVSLCDTELTTECSELSLLDLYEFEFEMPLEDELEMPLK